VGLARFVGFANVVNKVKVGVGDLVGFADVVPFNNSLSRSDQERNY